MSTSIALAPLVGIVTACAALGVARATFYRAQSSTPRLRSHSPRRPSPWALSDAERALILVVLRAPAEVDRSPHTVFALLLDGGR